jgi:hypothetical protein
VKHLGRRAEEAGARPRGQPRVAAVGTAAGEAVPPEAIVTGNEGLHPAHLSPSLKRRALFLITNIYFALLTLYVGLPRTMFP